MRRARVGHYGPRTNERVVLLSCGHEQNHPDRQVGEELACLSCPQQHVTRSHLNLQTSSRWRQVMKVVEVPANVTVYSIGGS